MKPKRVFSESGNKKGLWCPFKPMLCQEGYCSECQIYHEWQKEDSAGVRNGGVKEGVVKI